MRTTLVYVTGTTAIGGQVASMKFNYNCYFTSKRLHVEFSMAVVQVKDK